MCPDGGSFAWAAVDAIRRIPVDDYDEHRRAPLNPRYGTGCYRRAIHLRAVRPGRVEAALEDDPHAFALSLEHDGRQVTGIDARAVRVPLTTCPGAAGPLRAVVGAPLGTAVHDLRRFADPRSNCTHLFDLAALAIAHAARGDSERRYELHVPDEIDGAAELTLDCNGGRVLSWSVERGVIRAPERYAGQAVLGGFTRWAVANLDEQTIEYALIMQRGYFVGHSRRYDMEALGAGCAADDPMPMGACYSYSPGTVERAYRIPGSRIDFSDCPERLLRWETRADS